MRAISAPDRPRAPRTPPVWRSCTLVLALVSLLGSQAAQAQPPRVFGASLPPWAHGTFLGVSLAKIFGVLGLIGLALIIRRIVAYVVSSQLQQVARVVSLRLEQIVSRSAMPLSGLSMALVFAVGFEALEFPGRVNQVVALAVRVLAVASGVLLLYRQIDVVSDLLMEKAARTETRLDDQLVPLVRRTLKTFTIVIGGIFVLQNLNIDVASLVAGLGLGGLAFALAAKDTLANVFGSLVIFVDRPFQIGDWVVIGTIEGTVEDVGFRTTRIRTFYDSRITVPNAKLTDTAIDNMGMRTYRRIKLFLGLTYATKPSQMQAFVEGLRAIVAAHPDTRKDRYEIHFNGFGAYSLDVLFYVFVKVDSWSDELRARHELLLSALELADRLGVEFAFPTRTLHLDSMPGHTVERARLVIDRDELQAVVESYGPGGGAANPRFGLTDGFYPGASTRRGSLTEVDERGNGR